MRKIFSLLSAIALVASVYLVPNPSLATQKSINAITTSSIKTNKSQGHQSDTTFGKRGVAPVEKAVPGDKSGAPASGGGNGNGASKKPVTKLSSPKGIIFSSIVAESFIVHWTSVENSVDYQIRVYRANGQAIVFEDNIGGAITVFTVNSGVDLSENTYRVSVQALAGDNSGYADSPESGKFVVAIPVCGSDGLIVGTTNICQVGDTGPGGGVIFYYSAVGFNCGADLLSTCHFLEVAPSGWSGLETDPHLSWSLSAFTFNNILEIADDSGPIPNNTLIGRGFFNSEKIVNLNGSCVSVSVCTYAAGATRAYSSTSNSQTFSDWFLPNVSELNQLCKYVKGLAWISDSTVCTGDSPASLGIQTSLSYWSSSEGGTDFHAWVQYMVAGSQFGQAYKAERDTQWVRPIRSF